MSKLTSFLVLESSSESKTSLVSDIAKLYHSYSKDKNSTKLESNVIEAIKTHYNSEEFSKIEKLCFDHVPLDLTAIICGTHYSDRKNSYNSMAISFLSKLVELFNMSDENAYMLYAIYN